MLRNVGGLAARTRKVAIAIDSAKPTNLPVAGGSASTSLSGTVTWPARNATYASEKIRSARQNQSGPFSRVCRVHSDDQKDHGPAQVINEEQARAQVPIALGDCFKAPLDTMVLIMLIPWRIKLKT
jgi:hypothetical protein